MHHFAYRNGVLHAEAVNLDTLAASGRDAVLLLFDRDAGAALQGVRRRLRRRARAGLLRHEGEFQPGRDQDAGQARRRRRRGVGRRAQARARRRHSRRQDHVLRHRQDRARTCARGRRGHSLHQCRIRARARTCCRRSRHRRARTAPISVRVNPDIDAKTHHKIATGKAENKFGIPISRAREVYARAAKLPGLKVAGVDMHIGSQITDLDPFGNAFALLAEFVRTLRADGHTISHVDLGGGLGHSLSRRQRAAAASGGLCRGGQARHARSRLPADLRARPADRRQCRYPGDARAVREARRGEEFRRGRCGDERSDPPDFVRRASRDLAGRAKPPHPPAASAPTWSGRSAKAAISSPSTAIWRNRQAAHCWRSCRRAPMGRCRPAPTIPGRWCRKCW